MGNQLTRFVQSFLLVSSLALLAGCATTPTAVVTEIPRQKLVLPQPDILILDPVNWVVVTEQNAATVFADLKKQGVQPVIIGLTDKGYEALSLNTAKIRAFSMQQKYIIEAYKAYYIDEAPTNVNKPMPSAVVTPLPPVPPLVETKPADAAPVAEKKPAKKTLGSMFTSQGKLAKPASSPPAAGSTEVVVPPVKPVKVN